MRLASIDNRRSKRAALSGGRFHSYSRREANRSRERFSTVAALYRMPSWLRRGPRDSGSNAIPKRDRIAEKRPKPREADTSPRPALALATARDLWGFARIYVCSGRRVWLPRPHPRRVTHMGPSGPSEPDVPVRFDRRSIIVKSLVPFLLPASRRGFTQVADRPWSTDRSIDRSYREFCLVIFRTEIDDEILIVFKEQILGEF